MRRTPLITRFQRTQRVSGAVLLIAVGGLIAGAILPAWRSVMFGCAIVIAIELVIGFVLKRRMENRLLQLHRMNWCACLYCFHDLRGCGPRNRCPECGAPYDMYDTRETWKENMARLLPPDEPGD